MTDSPRPTTETIDFDGAWKEALDRHLEDALRLLFPQEALLIDSAKGTIPLDKELQKVAPADDRRAKAVDKLVQASFLSGNTGGILIHVEVQSQYDAYFARRMLNYNTHLFEHFGFEVNSLAIFGDESRTWKPDRFSYGTLSKTSIVYPVAKLNGLKRAELETNPNPFVMMVLAHLTAQETRGQTEMRAVRKVELARRMLEQGFSEDVFDEYNRLMDRLLDLPDELETRTYNEIKTIREEYKMAFVSSAERYGLREGRKEGLREGIAAMIEFRFGEAGRSVKEEIAQINTVATLEAILEALKTVATPEDLREIYAPTGWQQHANRELAAPRRVRANQKRRLAQSDPVAYRFGLGMSGALRAGRTSLRPAIGDQKFREPRRIGRQGCCCAYRGSVLGVPIGCGHSAEGVHLAASWHR